MIHTANLPVNEEVWMCQKLYRWDKELEFTWSFWHVWNHIKSDRLRLNHRRLWIFANQTKRVQEVPKRSKGKGLYSEDNISSAWSLLQSQYCGNTGVTWVKERGANKWASQTWQLVELQITSNLAKVYCSTRRCATCYMMHISPIPHHTSLDHEALPLRIFANKIERRQKGGSLKTCIYRKPTSAICMRISRER